MSTKEEESAKVAGRLGAPFLGAWIVMLAIGVLHHLYRGIPSLGYWVVFLFLEAFAVISYAIARSLRTGWNR